MKDSDKYQSICDATGKKDYNNKMFRLPTGEQVHWSVWEELTKHYQTINVSVQDYHDLKELEDKLRKRKKHFNTMVKKYSLYYKKPLLSQILQEIKESISVDTYHKVSNLLTINEELMVYDKLENELFSCCDQLSFTTLRTISILK